MISQKDIDDCCDAVEQFAEDALEAEYAGPWVVCLFLVDRAYGGPEEGGWYYDTGTPVVTEHMRAFANRDEARAYRRSLDPVVKDMNEGRYPISSVLSEGRYAFELCEGLPEAYPSERPYYS